MVLFNYKLDITAFHNERENEEEWPSIYIKNCALFNRNIDSDNDL